LPVGMDVKLGRNRAEMESARKSQLLMSES
jgi:hypothetical protein